MNKILEALERLAMPDDLHKKECEKLGIPTTQDYETLKAFILQNQNTNELTLGQLWDGEIIETDEVAALWCKGWTYFMGGKTVYADHPGQVSVDTGRTPTEVANQNRDKRVCGIAATNDGCLIISLADIVID